MSPLVLLENGALPLCLALLSCSDGGVRRLAGDVLMRAEAALAGVGLRQREAVEQLFEMANQCVKETLGACLEAA